MDGRWIEFCGRDPTGAAFFRSGEADITSVGVFLRDRRGGLIVGLVGENTTRKWVDAEQKWMYLFDEDLEYDIEWSVTTADDLDRPLGEVQPQIRDDALDFEDNEESTNTTVLETGNAYIRKFTHIV